MVGRVLSLYLRAGIGAANFSIRVAARSVEVAMGAVRAVVPYSADGTAVRDVDNAFTEHSEPISEPPSTPVITPEPPEAIDYDAEPPTPLEDSAVRAKAIDDEPELVAEFAEPGAEDGATAETRVDEPWSGYQELSADDVVDRIDQADAAQLAVIELYERTHKDRQTVLAAAERRRRALDNAPS